MKRKNRNRIKRNQRTKQRHRLKNYLIITDGEKTEVNYFNGLKNSLPDDYKDKISIKVIKSESPHTLIGDAKKCIEENKFNGYEEIWLIFDRDEVKGFDDIIIQAECNGYNVGWSNPCIEIWFLSYFGMNPIHYNSKQCIGDFKEVFKKIVEKNYKKNDTNIYHLLRKFGDEEKAIEISKNRYNNYLNDHEKTSNMHGATRVFEVVEEIRNAKIK